MKLYSKLRTVSIPSGAISPANNQRYRCYNVYRIPLNRWSFHCQVTDCYCIKDVHEFFLRWSSSAKRLESRSVQISLNKNHICKKVLLPAFYKQARIRLPNCTRFHTLPPAPARAVRPTLVPSWKPGMYQGCSSPNSFNLSSAKELFEYTQWHHAASPWGPPIWLAGYQSPFRATNGPGAAATMPLEPSKNLTKSFA